MIEARRVFLTTGEYQLGWQNDGLPELLNTANVRGQEDFELQTTLVVGVLLASQEATSGRSSWSFNVIRRLALAFTLVRYWLQMRIGSSLARAVGCWRMSCSCLRACLKIKQTADFGHGLDTGKSCSWPLNSVRLLI
jgi:hypothetical protein